MEKVTTSFRKNDIKKISSVLIATIMILTTMTSVVTVFTSTVSADETSVCEVELNLPTDPVSMSASLFPPSGESTFTISITGIEGLYDVMNGEYDGWCVEYGKAHNTMPIEVVLQSSYTPPEPVVHENWHKVNYILNNKQGNRVDVQRAIWFFVNFGPWDWDQEWAPYITGDVTQETYDMIADANQYADEWCPGCGDVVAVICDPGTPRQYQLMIIEVTLCDEQCMPEISLPTYPVFMSASLFPPSGESTFSISITGIEGLYDVMNGEYDGWCVEYGKAHNTMPIEVVLQSSYTPPEPVVHENWHKVNYILNNKQGNRVDVQRAIWFFVNFGPWDWDREWAPYITGDVTQETYDMIADANQYADEWCPGCGDVVAVICDPGIPRQYQLMIIEVTLCEDQSCEPVLITTVGDPKLIITENNEYCITSETEISIEALMDESCCNSSPAVIEYRVFFNDEWSEWMMYTDPITFLEECTHLLEAKATNCLEDVVYHNMTFYVDNTAPVLHKTVGYPSFYLGQDPFGHDVWYAFPQTEIAFSAEDSGCCPCAEPMIYYRYWFLGKWTNWTIYNQPVTFNRGCLHYLEAYAVDCLGNKGSVDNETFIVHVPDGYDDPRISFQEPQHHETYCDRILHVLLNASDHQTPSEELTVVLWIPEGRRGAPRLYYPTTYDPADGLFHAFIDIYKYQHGAQITLEAYVLDTDGNYAFALPVTFIVCSTTGYDQWMPLGWESLTIPPGEIGCSDDVTDVLASIDGYYDWVFYRDTVTGIWYSFEYGAGGNDLQTMKTGEVYWVHMTTADRFYTDSTAPEITINVPEDGDILNTLSETSGIAYDGETGVALVSVMIQDMSTDLFWDEDSWEPSATELLCSGTETWMYDTSAIEFVSGHSYKITAMVWDNAGCMATDMVTFLWDANPPIISILDPVDGEERFEGPSDIDLEVIDLECYVAEVFVAIYDQTTDLYYDGSSWQALLVWLEALHDSDDAWYYPTEGIWPAELGHSFQVLAKAYDCIGNMGTQTSSFTIIEPYGDCIPDRTYTTNADFDEGILVGVEYDTTPNQLQLIADEVTVYPVMWIANAGESSVSKWDTRENKELARYKTFFYGGGSHSGPAPSRTCVDAEGNCYVANRQFASNKPADVIKILANDWIDRNGNGVLDTSYDANNDGYIDASEMLPLVDLNSNNKIDPEEIQDERIAWAVEVGPDNGLGRSLALDLDGNLWLGCYSTYSYYKISGVDGSLLAGPLDVSPNTPYGAVVDKNGILWGSSLSYNLLELNTNTLTKTVHNTPGLIYGIALGYDSLGNTLVYMGARYSDTFYVYNTSSETFSSPAALRYDVFGIAVDLDGYIYAGHGSWGTMAKFAPNGSVVWNAPAQLATHVRGTVVDADGDVWAIHLSDNKMCKYNGTDGSPLGVFNTGNAPYTYSDAAGLSYSQSLMTGKWTVIYDSYAPGTTWNKITWNADVPEGTSLTVKVRSSDDQTSWSPWEPAENGVGLLVTPASQYLEIEVLFKAPVGGDSPVLYDLTVDGTCAFSQEEPAIDMIKQVWRPLVYNETDEFVTYVYTIDDIVVFGYENETTISIYDTSDVQIWTGTINDGEYHHQVVYEGVFKIIGSKKFAVLIGDPISNYVMGFYAMDQNGYGASTKLYTYMPQSFSSDYFIVFAYTDGSEVTITNMDTSTIVWSGTLNKGEHYADTTLSADFVKVESNYPVSALSYNDQGYFVPSANQKFAGTEFYTFAGYVGSWKNTLHVMAYYDNTAVTIINTVSGDPIWNGVLNAGEEYKKTTSSNIYYTILTDKDVTVAVLPINGWSSAYYHGTYVSDRTGSCIGTEFYTPSLAHYADSSILEVFAYSNATIVYIYNAATKELVGTYNLDKGDHMDINPGYGYWHITSNNPISVYEGMDAASASFAPVLFGEAFGGYWAKSREAMVDDVARFKLTVYNIGETDYDLLNVSDVLPSGLIYAGSATVNGVPMEPTWLSDDSHSFAWVDPFVLHPGQWGAIEFDATVTICGEMINMGSATAYYSYMMVSDEDTAMVQIDCDCLNIVEMAVSQNPDEFNTLVQAVVAAGLVDVLSNLSNDFTVFAPIDAAFADLDPVFLQNLLENDTATLIEILTYHVVPGVYMAADLYDGLMLQTVQGSDLVITVDAVVFVNDAQVVLADIVCCNGVIHVIDKVLVPPVNNPPYAPYNPTPENGTTNVMMTTPALGWYGGDPDVGDSVFYDVYFGADPGALVKLITIGPYDHDENPFSISFGIALMPETIYYWQIVAEDNHGLITDGPVWSFTTAEAPPVGSPPVVIITYPLNESWFNYSMAGGLTINGTTYDVDTYVDMINVALYYLNDSTPIYYGWNDSTSEWSWSTTEHYFPAYNISGTGTLADPLEWEILLEPAFPVDNIIYYVHAKAYDHDPVPLMGEDTNYFWYPEEP